MSALDLATTRFSPARAKAILELCEDRTRLESTQVVEFMVMLVICKTGSLQPSFWSGNTPQIRLGRIFADKR